MTAYDQQGDGVVYAVDSVTAANNADGLTVVLDASGRPFVNVYYNVGGDAVISVEGRNGDGSWRPIGEIDTSGADTDNESLEQYPWQAFEEVRATTNTPNVGVEIEVSAGR